MLVIRLGGVSFGGWSIDLRLRILLGYYDLCSIVKISACVLLLVIVPNAFQNPFGFFIMVGALF